MHPTFTQRRDERLNVQRPNIVFHNLSHLITHGYRDRCFLKQKVRNSHFECHKRSRLFLMVILLKRYLSRRSPLRITALNQLLILELSIKLKSCKRNEIKHFRKVKLERISDHLA